MFRQFLRCLDQLGFNSSLQADSLTLAHHLQLVCAPSQRQLMHIPSVHAFCAALSAASTGLLWLTVTLLRCRLAVFPASDPSSTVAGLHLPIALVLSRVLSLPPSTPSAGRSALIILECEYMAMFHCWRKCNCSWQTCACSSAVTCCSLSAIFSCNSCSRRNLVLPSDRNRVCNSSQCSFHFAFDSMMRPSSLLAHSLRWLFSLRSFKPFSKSLICIAGSCQKQPPRAPTEIISRTIGTYLQRLNIYYTL